MKVVLFFALLFFVDRVHSAGVILHSSNGISDRYIVQVMESSQLFPVMLDVSSRGGIVDQRLELFDAFVVNMTESLVNVVREDPRIWYIEQDMTGHINSWGLDRIDQRYLPLDGQFLPHALSAPDVTVYIVDTGIQFTHPKLEGRASLTFDVFGGTGSDCNGHGTHLAGIVHDISNPRIKSVRVMDCLGSGSASKILSGLQAVVQDLSSQKKVVLLSVTFSDSITIFDRSIRKMIDYGCVVVSAAGNANTDACTISPGSVRDTIRVGATTQNDMRASFSNYGQCVTLFAPGVLIESSWLNGGTSTQSGTSAAAAHAAGVAAMVLQQFVPDVGGRTLPGIYVLNKMVAASTQNVLASLPYGSPNMLLYSSPTGEGYTF